MKDTEDFYERVHKNSDLISVNFMDMKTEDAHKALCAVNRRLYVNYLSNRRGKMESETYRLYYEGKTDFRGFRAV